MNSIQSSWTSGRRTVQFSISTDDVANLADVQLMREVRDVVERALSNDPEDPRPLPEADNG